MTQISKYKIMKTTGLLLFFLPELLSAQCAMCRRVAETSHEAHENKSGGGLNTGIMYLLAIPYVLAGIGIYAYVRKRKA